ncbi:MAG TPA: hypothetical protein DC060_06635 [Gemmatimonadetes bacterium]|nr:hypothetical protein [Gemmatimonadota bacterium]
MANFGARRGVDELDTVLAANYDGVLHVARQHGTPAGALANRHGLEHATVEEVDDGHGAIGVSGYEGQPTIRGGRAGEWPVAGRVAGHEGEGPCVEDVNRVRCFDRDEVAIAGIRTSDQRRARACAAITAERAAATRVAGNTARLKTCNGQVLAIGQRYYAEWRSGH